MKLNEILNGVDFGSNIKRAAKYIKRGLHGWDKSSGIEPKELVKRNKGYDDATVKNLRTALKGDGKKTSISPGDLQQRVLDREAKKRGLDESNSDTFIYGFGRYSPTTVGHIAHFQAIKQMAQKHKAPYMVYTSKTVDNKKNPVPIDAKISYIKKAIPDLNIAPAVNMFKILDELIPQGYKRIIYVAGGDYFEEGSPEFKMFDRLVSYAAEQGVELSAISSGNRSEGISGSALRAAVLNGDFETFKQASPFGIGSLTEYDVKQMFNLVRTNLSS